MFSNCKKLLLIGLVILSTQNSWSQVVQNNSLVIDDSKSAFASKNFELASLLWGSQEIGTKLCEPTGEELPPSMKQWLEAVEIYLKSEKKRDQVINRGIDKLNKRILDLKTTNKPYNLQVETIQIQLSSYQLSIDSLRKRIELRTTLRQEIGKILKKSANEDKIWKNIFNKNFLKSGLDTSINIAKNACAVKPEPVAGCDEAIAQINQIYNESAKDYFELYNKESIASKEQNDQMEKLEEKMIEQIKAVPVSPEKGYNWHKAMTVGIEKMIDVRLASGFSCPPLKVEDKDTKESKELKITENAMVFLKALGITEELLNLEEKAKEKELKNYWIEADLLIGQSNHRNDFFKKIQSLLSKLNKIDFEKVDEINLNMTKLTKQLVATYDQLSSQATVEEQCGTAPLSPPGGYIVCPSSTNSAWCDTESPTRTAYDSYNSCVKEVKTKNDRLTAIGKLSESLKKDPNFVGVELVSSPTGSSWMAKVKNPDGTYKYVPLNYDAVKSEGPCASGTFQAGPANCATKPGATATTPTPAKPLEACKPDANGVVVGPCTSTDGKTTPAPAANPPAGGGGGGGGGGSSSAPSSSAPTAPKPATPPATTPPKPSAEELAEIEYKKQFNAEELKIYGELPTKTNFRLAAQAQPHTELKFSAKGTSIDFCTKSATGKTNCIKNDGALDGRAFISTKLDEKAARAKFHRVSFEFTSQNYFKLNPVGHFMLGLRGSWELEKDKEKAKSNMGDANGRGVIWGNIANIKENEGNPKCKDGAMEIKSYSKDAFALGIATRKEMLFTESCSDGLIKDGQAYRVEVDVLKSRHIFYRLYDKAGVLIYKTYVQDQENSRIDPQLTGWFIGHVFDLQSDNLDNDNDGKIDNETANWTMTIKNLKVFSATQLKADKSTTVDE